MSSSFSFILYWLDRISFVFFTFGILTKLINAMLTLLISDRKLNACRLLAMTCKTEHSCFFKCLHFPRGRAWCESSFVWRRSVTNSANKCHYICTLIFKRNKKEKYPGIFCLHLQTKIDGTFWMNYKIDNKKFLPPFSKHFIFFRRCLSEFELYYYKKIRARPWHSSKSVTWTHNFYFPSTINRQSTVSRAVAGQTRSFRSVSGV
jgi:hypothetical protein